MFIKILTDSNSVNIVDSDYSLKIYLNDFRKFTEIIFQEMIKHKYILKNDIALLSNEFINPLFLLFIESILDISGSTDTEKMVKLHVSFFWKAIKR
jgi:hypothetical protein